MKSLKKYIQSIFHVPIVYANESIQRINNNFCSYYLEVFNSTKNSYEEDIRIDLPYDFSNVKNIVKVSGGEADFHIPSWRKNYCAYIHWENGIIKSSLNDKLVNEIRRAVLKSNNVNINERIHIFNMFKMANVLLNQIK